MSDKACRTQQKEILLDRVETLLDQVPRQEVRRQAGRLLFFCAVQLEYDSPTTTRNRRSGPGTAQVHREEEDRMKGLILNTRCCRHLSHLRTVPSQGDFPSSFSSDTRRLEPA